MRLMNADEALRNVRSNDHIFIHTGVAIPQKLVAELASRHNELNNVTIYQLHTEGEAPYALPEMADTFCIRAFFVGKSTRHAVQSNQGSYIPIFLSEIPNLFRSGNIDLNVALISVSPPDKNGFCSLGPSVDISLAAIETADLVIAQINNFIPRTYGDALIPSSLIDIGVEYNEELPYSSESEIGTKEREIGKHIVELIEDGSTLQMGIGAIPNAVLASLGNHKDLGIHSEMFSDGILPLIEKEVINGRLKKFDIGFIVGSFAIGTKALFDFMHDNPMIKMMDSSYVNDTDVIRTNPKVVAINSAIELDLTGQVCADSIGNCIFSGVGGQMDFIRGAALSEGGKPIIALPSVTNKGESKIVPYLKTGAGVVTTRAHVHWVVTEYGAVNLYGKSIQERIKLLTSIAHPDHREDLERSASEMKN